MATDKEREIRASYDYHNNGDISTERLLQMVADDCDCEVYEVIEVLHSEVKNGNETNNI